MEQTHTPLPAQIEVECHLTDSQSYRVPQIGIEATLDDQKAFAIALSIRYNSHEALVAALKDAWDLLPLARSESRRTRYDRIRVLLSQVEGQNG